MDILTSHFDKYLPLNRKERFYTGTVLPQIICSNNFKNLHRFLELIDNFPKNQIISANPSNTNIQLMTEYSLKESYIELPSKKKFKNIPESKDTPDLIILFTYPELILIVVEAKMYTSSNAHSLETQMDNQLKIIQSIKDTLKLEDKNIFHVALVPRKLVSKKDFHKYQLIHWEDILDAYNEILTNDYFFKTLEIAISEFDDLTSKSNGSVDTFRKNMDTMISGAEIIELHKKGEKFFVGRNYGLYGKLLKEDRETGKWRQRKYEVNFTIDKVPNKNWFSSEQFVHFMIDEIKS